MWSAAHLLTAAPGSVHGAAHVVGYSGCNDHLDYQSVPWVYLIQVPLLNNTRKISFSWDFMTTNKSVERMGFQRDLG